MSIFKALIALIMLATLFLQWGVATSKMSASDRLFLNIICFWFLVVLARAIVDG